MDPNLVTALTSVLAGIFGGATGEVGAESVRRLLALVGGLRAEEVECSPAEVERSITDGQVDSAGEVAAALAALAEESPEFERELKVWLAAAGEQFRKPTVNNTIGGSVGGNVIQAGEINIDSTARRR